MDVSIVAAVGSFIVSERVIKAKATVLLGLLCLVCYDLTIHSHDPASLRVYRGPALISIALMLAAISLRSWRRNGVACDELLFLPGSPHAEKSHTNGKLADVRHRLPLNLRNSGRDEEENCVVSDADAAAGVGSGGGSKRGGAGRNGGFHGSKQDSDDNFIIHLDEDANSSRQEYSVRAAVSSSSSHDGTGGGDAAAEEEMRNIDRDNDNMEMVPILNKIEMGSVVGDSDGKEGEVGTGPNIAGADNDNAAPHSGNQTYHPGINILRRISTLCKVNGTFLRLRRRNTSSHPNANPNSTHANANNSSASNRHISTTTSRGLNRYFPPDSNEEYAPSGPAVAGAALDLALPVLFNFHIFMMATNSQKSTTSNSNTSNPLESSIHDSTSEIITAANTNNDGSDQQFSSIPPQVLPLIFLTIIMIRSIFPTKARKRFWNTIHDALFSPLANAISVREDLLGDLFTSLVRPMQDLCFAVFYYFASLYGILFGHLELEDSGRVLEHNLFLHNFVLPVCAVLPLLCRFLQTLRQAYIDRRRWPHLGNAFKYLSASLIIFYGMTHPEERRSKWWIFLFFIAMLYQIWWDVVMDWELLVICPNTATTLPQRQHDGTRLNMNLPSSGSGDHRQFYLVFHDFVLSPIKQCSTKLYNILPRIPQLSQIQLRSKRLYKSNNYYWRIVVMNACLRFAWMLSFIPAYHLNTETGDFVKTFSMDVKAAVGFAISLAELVRRCWWCILKVELETIKLTGPGDCGGSGSNSSGTGCVQYSCFLREFAIRPSPLQQQSSGVGVGGGDAQLCDASNYRGSSNSSGVTSVGDLPSTSSSSQSNALAMKKAANRLLVRKLFCIELCLWVVAYVLLSYWVAVVV